MNPARQSFLAEHTQKKASYLYMIVCLPVLAYHKAVIEKPGF